MRPHWKGWTDMTETTAQAPSRPDGCAERLLERFPALFAGVPRPLKLRIQVDIQEQAPGVFTKQELSTFLRRYTATTAYLVAIAKGTARFGLDGAPSGELSDEHRRVAVEELARRRALREERHNLEAQQRRNRATLLHDYDRTTLTAANFCALKAIAVEELEGLLAIARSEAQADAQRHPGAGREPHADRRRPPGRP
jgi:sRNA-binding protein